MKLPRQLFLLLAVCLLACASPAAHAAVSGTKTVGPTGDYTSIGAAITDIQTQTLNGALVLELQAAYVSSVETFPLTVPALTGASAVNTLTIRPAAGATALSISSADTTAATVDLNGAQFVTFDGRPGGAGTAKQLTIGNTSTAGVALRFINEASNNTLRHLTLRSVNTSATSGTVVFSTTTGANGNDNNTIDTCDIRDGATTPANGIYSLGTTTTTAHNNSGNTATNCNVFNFYAATAVASAGVLLEGGNTDWTISGNSFYQTASRAAVTANVRAIFVNTTSGNNFTVTGNFIGGSAASAGSTAWTTTGTSSSYLFQGIRLNVGTTTPSSVQGNTISNIVWTTSSSATSLPGVWSGIYVPAGNVNIGTVTGNTIGSGTGTGSISVTTSGGGGTSFGIGSASSGTVAILNNTIGSITVNGTTTTVNITLNGIVVTAGANTISNNLVGSTSTANSLNAATSSTSGATTHHVNGILSSSSTSASITGNTVANLNNNYAGAGSGGRIQGIVTSAGVNTITGNTVRNLSTTSQNAGTGVQQSVFGVIATSTTGGQTVSQNTVHSLANTAASANVNVTGIYFAGPTSGTNVIARNFVHSLAVSSTSASSVVNGMQFVAGTFTAQNNLVRVGFGAAGTSTAGASIVRGIYDNSTTAGRNFYHNSVYVGGTQTSGAANTFAFDGTSGVSNARTDQNNAFANARSNGSGTGKHYAVTYGGTTANPTGLTAGGNLFYVSGTGGVLGLYNGADRSTLAAWQAATGQDATSAVGDPLFVNPTGTSATVDLHLQASNPAERGGIALTDALTGATVTVTDDFDGQTRSTLTPADIGADAGSFTLSSDVFAPRISHPLLSSGSTANRVLTGWATITDNSGSVSGGANAPRLYFKKSTDADAFGVANDSTGNGWKYVTATGSGPYSFTLDYALINGGSVTGGDAVQYFVVAQDAANNLGSSPAGATASGNPPVPNVNGHGGVNSFTIVGTLSGTKTVGSGGDYASLSGAGGLFAALNGAVLTGNLVVNITSDLTENGSVALNEFASDDFPATRTLTVQPDSATMRTISGGPNAPLIALNGADRVTIDGRFGGSGRYLSIYNTAAGNSAVAIRFINDASGNTIRSSIIGSTSSASNPNGVVTFATGVTTGNNDNLIADNQIRYANPSFLPRNLVRSFGTSEAVANSNNTVSNNDLLSFTSTAINIDPTGNKSWTISGNNIHEVAGTTGSLIGISLSGGGVNTVVNNQITLIPGTSTSSTITGLLDNTSSGSVVNAFHNSIVIGGTESGAASSWASLRQVASTHTARNNLFLNLRTGGTGSHFAAGSEVSGGSYTASHNVYAGTGATAAIFMDFSGTPGTAVPVSYATWQSSTGDTSPSASNPGGNYSTAMFVNAATGDLHLVPGGNVLVNALGTPIAGITTDYDNDPRSATTPTIGADEVSGSPEIAVTGNSVSIADGDVTPSTADHTDFGNVAVTGSTLVRTFTITNSGTVNLTLSGTPKVAVSGTHAADFTVTTLPTSPVTASGSTTFQVTFDPSALGLRTATLTIANNDTDEGTFDFAIKGTGVNTPPTVVLPIADFAVNEDAANVVTNLTTIFSDIDTVATALTYAVVANTNTALVTATITQGTNLTLAFAANGNGTSRISVSATDPEGISVTNTFVVTVNPVNDAPVVVLPIANFAVNEDAANVVTNLTTIFTDIETPAVNLTYAVVANTNTGLVTVTLVQGTNLTLAFTANSNGTSQIAVSATDPGGLAVTNTFVVTVTAVNDAPTVLLAIADFTVNEDAANVVTNLTTIFTDLETAATILTYAVVANTNSSLVTATITSATNLTLAFTANGNGTSRISVSATDPEGLSVTNTFVVTVNAVNDAPVAVADSYSMSEGDVLTASAATGVLANDTDVESNALTATKLTDPAQGSVTLNANGSFTYTPNASFYGTDSFTYRAADASSNSNPATVSISVYARPTNAVPASQTVFSSATLRFSATNTPLANGLRVGDPDSTELTVSLTVTNGTVRVSVTNGLVFTAGLTNSTNVVMTGLTANVNAALESLAYTSKTNYFGDETLVIVTTDEGGRTNRGSGTVPILVEIPALGGVPKISLEGLNDPMTGRMITNVTALVLDTNVVQRVTFDPTNSVVNVLPVSGQDGSTNRSTITVRVQFSDGTFQTNVVPVIIYQPLLAATTNGNTTYNSTFSTPLFNLQNSLYEQKVRVQNNTPFDFTALRITATNLPATVTLQNATLTNGGLVYIDYNLAVLAGSNVTLKLEYFSSDLLPFTPGLKLELLNSTRTNTAPAGAVMTSVTPRSGYAPDGLVKNYLYFASKLGQGYYVQYQDVAGPVWKTSGVVIAGTGLDIHWMDDGPPNTDTPPGPVRFYRVVTDR